MTPSAESSPLPRVYPFRRLVSVAVSAFLIGALAGVVATRWRTTGGRAFQAQPTPHVVGVQTLGLGKTATTVLGNRVTLVGWEPKVAVSHAAPAGSAFSRIEVKWCASSSLGNGVSASGIAQSWTLQAPDSSTLAPQGVSYSNQDLVGLINTIVAPGQCVQGSVVFLVPDGKQPAFAVFNGAQTLKWSLDGTPAPIASP